MESLKSLSRGMKFFCFRVVVADMQEGDLHIPKLDTPHPLLDRSKFFKFLHLIRG